MKAIPVYSISILAQVCFDTRLSASAKLLYGEIARLCQEHGRCPLSNHYFAGLYRVTTKTVAAWIAQLEEVGYLRVRYDASGQQRLLYLEVLTKEEPDTNQLPLTFLP